LFYFVNIFDAFCTFYAALYGKKVKYKTYQECVMKISQFQAGKFQSIHAYDYQYFLPEPIDHGFEIDNGTSSNSVCVPSILLDSVASL
jgi:hypothetical protein